MRSAIAALTTLVATGVIAVAVHADATSNQAAARAAAQQEVTLTPQPFGMTRVQSDPSPGAILNAPATRPGTPNLIDVPSFWTAPEGPDSVFATMVVAPTGSTVIGQGSSSGPNQPTVRSITYGFADKPGVYDGAQLVVSITAGANGGSAIRADGQAVWIIPRAAGEVIPGGVTSVAVGILTGHTTSPARTITSPAKVAQLVALINGLDVTQPDIHSCPAITASTPMLDLRFDGAGGATLAHATTDGCLGVSFSINGKRQTGLQDDGMLPQTVYDDGDLPTCATRQLRAGAPTPLPTPPNAGASATQGVNIALTNTSKTACALDGVPTVGFAPANAHGKPRRLATTKPANNPFLTIVVPGAKAETELTWREHCAPNLKGTELVLTLPRNAQPITVSPSPLAPCNGPVTVGPLAEPF